jgi:hypothetical protein
LTREDFTQGGPRRRPNNSRHREQRPPTSSQAPSRG